MGRKGIYRRFWMGWLIEFLGGGGGGVDEGGRREEVGLGWLWKVPRSW